MSRLRSGLARRSAACLAVVALLFQLGLSAWHAAAMIGSAAGQGANRVQTAMMCHKAAVDTAADRHGSLPANKNCTCCLGLNSAGTPPVALSDFRPSPAVQVEHLAISDLTAAGRHPLSPDSRAPPLLV